MDKEDADISGVVAGLLKEDVLLEEFGGEVQCAHVSAKTGAGLEDLLDKILMQVMKLQMTHFSFVSSLYNVLCISLLYQRLK